MAITTTPPKSLPADWVDDPAISRADRDRILGERAIHLYYVAALGLPRRESKASDFPSAPMPLSHVPPTPFDATGLVASPVAMPATMPAAGTAKALAASPNP